MTTPSALPSLAVREKVKDYITAGRVRIITATRDEVDALVLGSSPDPYMVAYSPREGWFCGCPARTPYCTHVLAVFLVWRPGLTNDAQAFLDLNLTTTGDTT